MRQVKKHEGVVYVGNEINKFYLTKMYNKCLTLWTDEKSFFQPLLEQWQN